GEGMEGLTKGIAAAALKDPANICDPAALTHSTQSAALGSARQKKLVDTACAVLEEALALAEKEEPLDLIAPLLREAVNSLGEITGEVTTADILEEMFSRFCVGK
ncbi:MAG: tRNA uridine-5-carboxymethylaminomethyl(34) synthesis GTPase MnmE, partial [Treponema sp.]|nr:tRNA uridine-5-carboxymethylaminomethyl(34) synthesis GTPase MnmE [Treponema sp.]